MKKNKYPTISVVMPVYNAGKFLHESVESILNQTFSDFEFIIVDDASTDNSYSILKNYAKKDKRIKLFKNEKNLSQGATVTKALQQARGEFIARMDADDIAVRNRFAKQLDHLLNNPRTVAVGGQCLLVDKKGKKIGEKTFPLEHEGIYKYIFEFCPVQQPTLMFAIKRLPQDFSFYDHGMSPVEDVELLFKLFKYGRVENLPDYLLKYRIHDNNSSLKSFKKSFYLTLLSRIRGVLLHEYRPTIKGIFVTIAQTIIVALLPQNAAYSLYSTIKSIHKTTITTGIPSLIRFSLFDSYRTTLARFPLFF